MKKTPISISMIKAYLFRFLDLGIILITLIFAVLVDQRVLTGNVFYISCCIYIFYQSLYLKYLVCIAHLSTIWV